MKAIRNNVIFKPFPSDETTEGGLFVPESVRQTSNKGVLVSVGNGTAKTPMQFKEGDVVHRTKGWGNEVIVNGEKLYIMDQGSILASVN